MAAQLLHEHVSALQFAKSMVLPLASGKAKYGCETHDVMCLRGPYSKGNLCRH